MKKLLSIVVLVCATLASHAQTLTVKNSSSCTVYYKVYAGTSCSSTTTPCATALTAIAPGGSATYSLTNPPFFCNPTEFIHIIVNNGLSSSSLCPLVGTDVGNAACGFATSGSFTTASGCPACSGQTIKVAWISASAVGSVTVDIN